MHLYGKKECGKDRKKEHVRSNNDQPPKETVKIVKLSKCLFKSSRIERKNRKRGTYMLLTETKEPLQNVVLGTKCKNKRKLRCRDPRYPLGVREDIGAIRVGVEQEAEVSRHNGELEV